MTKKTEQKIIDAALKIFSEKGYVGATTKIIAQKSGFSEMTLFRKFETKEKLFEAVITQYTVRSTEYFDEILAKNDQRNPKERFKFLIHSLVDLMDNNFDFVNIIIYERARISDSVTKHFVFHLGRYLKENFPNTQINHNVLAFNILSFNYFIIFNKRFGSNYLDVENAVEEFINYNTHCLQL